MNKLNAAHVVKTATTFVGILYIICAFLVLVIPKATVQFFNLWFHTIDLAAIPKEPTFWAILLGFISVIVTTTLATLVFVNLWNKFLEVKR